MFKAIVSTATLRDVLDSISVLIDECKIRLSEESPSIRAIDPANIGMADLILDAAVSESHGAHGGVIGISLPHLEEVAGMVGAGDLTHLTLDEETRRLSIRIDGPSYTLTFIDPGSIRQGSDISDPDLTVDIVLEGTHLDRGVKAANMVPDRIRLRADGAEKTFHIEAEGDTDDVDPPLPSADLTSVEADAVDSLFLLDCLKDMNGAIPTDAEVTIELGEEFPVKLHYQIAERMGTIMYMLVPRIQSDRADVSVAVSLSDH